MLEAAITAPVPAAQALSSVYVQQGSTLSYREGTSQPDPLWALTHLELNVLFDDGFVAYVRQRRRDWTFRGARESRRRQRR